MPWYNSTMLDPLDENGFSFETTENILTVDCPIMIVHAKDDDVIPYFLGEKVSSSYVILGFFPTWVLCFRSITWRRPIEILVCKETRRFILYLRVTIVVIWKFANFQICQNILGMSFYNPITILFFIFVLVIILTFAKLTM